MSITPVQFGQIAQVMGLFVLCCAIVSGIAFVQQRGWRFRMVGVTLFSVVLTAGLFALSLTPITRETVVGAVPYTTVFDRFGSQAVIAVAPEITIQQLTATLKQAGNRLFSPGRNAQGNDFLTIRARTIIHPRPGVSEPLYLGELQRSSRQRDDPTPQIKIFQENWDRLNVDKTKP